MSDSPYRLGDANVEPERRCAKCDYLFDRSTEVIPADEEQSSRMTEGEVTLCINCGEAMILEKDTLRSLTTEELAAAPKILHFMQRSIRALPR